MAYRRKKSYGRRRRKGAGSVFGSARRNRYRY